MNNQNESYFWPNVHLFVIQLWLILGFIRIIIFKFQLLPIVLLVDDAVFLVVNDHMEHFVIGLYLLL